MVIALAWVLLAGSPEPTKTSPPGGWVRTWTDRERPYERGGAATVFFRLDEPGYVTAFRVDTDGRVLVLFPRTPWADNYVLPDRTLKIANPRDDYTFAVDDAAGVGYIFVIASPRQFDYADVARDDHWDYRAISGGRIRGDPYVALTDLAERISPRAAYDYDVTPYYVDNHYDYPRFVCAQCHSSPRDRDWDEYRLECARFRLVIYDDPAYYAYRYGRGRNVVINRPLHPGPRFVFRDAAPGAGYVTRLRGRPDEAEWRRARQLSPVRPLVERHRIEERRREPVRERRRERREERRAEPRDRHDDGPDDRPDDGRSERRRRSGREKDDEPRSTGRPELRRRKP